MSYIGTPFQGSSGKEGERLLPTWRRLTYGTYETTAIGINAHFVQKLRKTAKDFLIISPHIPRWWLALGEVIPSLLRILSEWLMREGHTHPSFGASVNGVTTVPCHLGVGRVHVAPEPRAHQIIEGKLGLTNALYCFMLHRWGLLVDSGLNFEL